MPAVVQPCDRLLSRVAPLRETDRALLQPRLGGQNAIVDLSADARRQRLDPEPLESVIVDRNGIRRRIAVEQFVRRQAVVAVPDCSGGILVAEHERREMPFHSRYAGHPYIGEIAFVDSQVGRLLSYLDAHHLAANTVVVAITRALAVSRSASHASPCPSASMSFESMRWRYDTASGPLARTYERGRPAVCNG